jgi:hypothetical protein
MQLCVHIHLTCDENEHRPAFTLYHYDLGTVLWMIVHMYQDNKTQVHTFCLCPSIDLFVYKPACAYQIGGYLCYIPLTILMTR